MKRINYLFKFYKRYEVDLWGKSGFKHNLKLIKFLKKINDERINYLNYLRRFDFKTKTKTKSNVFNLNKNIKFIKSKINLQKEKKIVKKKFIRFTYRIDLNEPKRKRKRTSLSRELFIINKKLRSFYGNIKRLQLRRYVRKKVLNFKLIHGLNLNNFVKFQNKNIFKKVLAINSFFSILEHRLDMLLYRSNFSFTIYHARHLIRYKKVFVNNKLISFCNFKLKNFDIISLDKQIELKIIYYLKKKLKKKHILNYPPSYIYVNYNLMLSSIIKNPTYKMIPFPFKIDLKKWLGLAKMNV